MAKKNSALAKNSLKRLITSDLENTVQEISEAEQNKSLAIEIPIKDIKPNPYQPRRIFGIRDLESLANSIKKNGLIQPILVRIDVVGYVLIVGERRLKACQIAGFTTINAIAMDINDAKMREIALVENIQRVNLTAIEEAVAFRELIVVLKITQQQLADRIDKSRAYVTNIMRLLQLPNKVQDLILNRKISMGQARPLITLVGNPALLNQVVQKIMKDNLTTEKIEALVKKLKTSTAPVQRILKSPKLVHDQLAHNISKQLNTKVRITDNSLIIKFTSVKSLNKILKQLNLLYKD